MKRLIQNIILFGIVLLGINLLAYRFIAEPLLYKGYFIAKSKMKPYRSFFLGDSHAKAIRQKDLGKLDIFNLAYDSDSYFDCALKLEYLVRNKMIDTAYICVDNHTLSKYREWWTNKSRSIYYSTYKDYSKYYKTSEINFWTTKYIGYYLPLFDTKNSKIFKTYLFNLVQGKKPRNYDNYDASTSRPGDLMKSARNRVETQFPDTIQSEKLVQALYEIIEICEQNKVIIYGIKFPLTREYIDVMGNKSYKADSLFISNELKVYDFSYIFPDSTKYFRDQDHVNYTGSEKFVEYILQSGKL